MSIIPATGGRHCRDHKLLDLQLPVQSVPITFDVVSLNLI